MSTCKYTYPLISEAESNDTLIATTVIRVLDCNNSVQSNSLCGLWNFSRCPADKDYCQPFVSGDVVYKQIHAPKNYYQYSFIHIYDADSGAEITNTTDLLTTETGFDSNDTIYSNFIINTDKLVGVKCFYFKYVGFTCKFKEPSDIADFNTCVNDLIASGKNTQEAREICLTSMCPNNMDVMYSEPYCEARCQDTLLIEGHYTKYDCNGNYYAPFIAAPTTNSYVSQMRIYGVVEPSEFLIEEVIVNTTKKSSKQIKIVNLLSKPLPFYVVEQLATIFNSQYVKVDGITYEGHTNLSKNNEEGLMWIIKTPLRISCDDINFTCE